MKDALVFPAWTQAAGPDHYLLCVLPQQTNSNDCGVFMLMYALYTVLDIPFNFSQSIISGQKKSKWLDTFSKCSVKTVPVQVYIDNQEQVDAIYSHLSSILDSTPMHMHSDKVKFIMDVLFPESIICALAFVENLSILEAEEKFLRGPVIDLRYCRDNIKEND
ncbi:hypothetical protein QQF64_002941 [Cirrhinus molitorella]|uniref:PWWP domain-containing protein n=1 Tax=Cirrhinus molitorella TaxID=172907 RepID=A0ABR3MRK2_9TELE